MSLSSHPPFPLFPPHQSSSPDLCTSHHNSQKLGLYLTGTNVPPRTDPKAEMAADRSTKYLLTLSPRLGQPTRPLKRQQKACQAGSAGSAGSGTSRMRSTGRDGMQPKLCESVSQEVKMTSLNESPTPAQAPAEEATEPAVGAALKLGVTARISSRSSSLGCG